MEVTGKIIHKLEQRGGISKTGNQWRSQEYVLETFDTYPRKVLFDFYGDKIDQYPLNVGDTVKVSFDIDSREYNGRWFVSVRAWKSEPANAATPGAPQVNTQVNVAPQSATPTTPSTDFTLGAGEPTDDLPF